MSSSRYRAPGDPGPSTSKRPRVVDTLAPETAHERHQRLHALRRAYDRGKPPPRPASRHELDVLKERHQFVRDSDVDPSTLSWEDQLAHRHYETLFREYAVVNLKHYKSGAIALRWRTESEVLSGTGHLTCGSLRCAFHAPSPAVLASLSLSDDVPPDPADERPLVEARLEELEVPFRYVEAGEAKSVLVKVVLCRECARKLRHGRRKAKEDRDKRAEVDPGACVRLLVLTDVGGD
ncbi:folate-sensitive fragile site protein Fra10Ac1-domain-containing protein [Rhodotorula diobovata]|uniref:Folate-sensitive fragile site protein Fra10Ac1-domain-containing protein n=1 Tax=Rhodotorula diobovata TaxID=5288 RepID=A0A5C5FPI0_9BASI|nr:folate-sensitive fragile site protein Fra10Ac1-domain-containing protein [Rhodotorula diobovata]